MSANTFLKYKRFPLILFNFNTSKRSLPTPTVIYKSIVSLKMVLSTSYEYAKPTII